MRQIWIMIKPIVPRNLFVEKSEFKFWVALKNLSNSNKIRTMFFNCYGSTIEECSYVYFLYNPQQKPYTILEILQSQLTGFFNVFGKLQWVEKNKNVSCDFNRVRLTTNLNTTINSSDEIFVIYWSKNNVYQELTKICTA